MANSVIWAGQRTKTGGDCVRVYPTLLGLGEEAITHIIDY